MKTTLSTSNKDKNHIYMGLYKEPISKQSIALIETLYNESFIELKRQRASRPLKEAIGGIVADVLAIPESTRRSAYAYRCVGAHDFWDCPVGFKAFKEARRALESLGYMDVEVGFRAITGSRNKSEATKFRRTAKLDALMSSHGIDHHNRDDNFVYLHASKTLVCPLEMRTASTKKFKTYGDKTKGKKQKPNFSNGRMTRERDRMKRVNNFLFKQEYDYELPMVGPRTPFNGVRRIFNNTDKCGHFLEGGRMYGRFSCYQSLPKKLRAGLRINGERGVEIDVGSCFLSIFTHLNGGTINPAVDLYDGCSIPRDIAKKYVGQAMGSNKLPRKWSDELKEKYINGPRDEGVTRPTELQDAYPIGIVQAAVLDAIPILKLWNDSAIRWGQLFYLESEAMLAAIEELMDLGIPALPLHDALIVPASKTAEGRSVIERAFMSQIGFVPRISIK